MKCKKCNCPFFKIDIIPCCDECRENAAWVDVIHGTGSYTLNKTYIEYRELKRNHVEENGECEMGAAYGDGCYMFTCANCGARSHLPMSDSC